MPNPSILPQSGLQWEHHPCGKSLQTCAEVFSVRTRTRTKNSLFCVATIAKTQHVVSYAVNIFDLGSKKAINGCTRRRPWSYPEDLRTIQSEYAHP